MARVERLKNAQINARGGAFPIPKPMARIACFTIMYVARRAPSGRTFIERTSPPLHDFEREQKNVDTGRRGLACKRNGVEWGRGKGIGKVGRGTGMLPEKGTGVGGEKSKGRTRTER